MARKKKAEITAVDVDTGQITFMGSSSVPVKNVDEIHEIIKLRMEQLKPLLAEYNELEQAQKALSKLK